MKYRFACLVLALAFGLAPAAEKVAPVKTGAGVMTFETVPGWGLDEKGKSVLGSTHGGVAVGKDGSIYTSSSLGVFVFSPEGKVINRFLGDKYSNMHDLKINQEGDAEFLYGARNNNAEGVKLNTKTGDIVLKLPYPEESGLKLTRQQFSPTAITVAPNGDIYLSNGYASNHIFKFDKTGKYLMHFGTKGNGLKEFNTAHGMTLDTRYTPPRLLICDRNHSPNGRLVHYSLEGEFLGEVITGLGMPTSAIVQGDYVSVPDLKGWVTIIGKDNKIVAELGKNPDPKKGANFGIPQDQWVEGAFSGTHGSAWDKDGNLYVQDWNVSGRIMKLVRVK
ncbi:6-bladed beta-propeller [Zavarzinella formosa]|uniref:6-bladed beta-propeller n=1 Tax=Zavarzinella formosa TaxID=360055 RepID=UPI0002DA29F6|nr:6-bladed beta-propeller [Zavarzinella formosa]